MGSTHHILALTKQYKVFQSKVFYLKITVFSSLILVRFMDVTCLCFNITHRHRVEANYFTIDKMTATKEKWHLQERREQEQDRTEDSWNEDSFQENVIHFLSITKKKKKENSLDSTLSKPNNYNLMLIRGWSFSFFFFQHSVAVCIIVVVISNKYL